MSTSNDVIQYTIAEPKSNRCYVIDLCQGLFGRLSNYGFKGIQRRYWKDIPLKSEKMLAKVRIISIHFLHKKKEKKKIFQEQHFCTYAPFHTSHVMCQMAWLMIILRSVKQFILSSSSLKFTILTFLYQFLSSSLKIHSMLEWKLGTTCYISYVSDKLKVSKFLVSKLVSKLESSTTTITCK